MSWFDEDAGRPLLSVLHEAFRSTPFGAVTIVGREGGGQVFFAAREVVFATCDGEVPLRSVLELSGAADHALLTELVRTTGEPLGTRRVPPAVEAVVRDHTDAALAVLQTLRVGRARVDAGDSPPFGPLMSVTLAELVRSAALVDVRARAAAVRRLSTSEPRSVRTPALVAVESVPATEAGPAASRSSALRRLIGAMRQPRPDTAHA
jgi:hypothetical protein